MAFSFDVLHISLLLFWHYRPTRRWGISNWVDARQRGKYSLRQTLEGTVKYLLASLVAVVLMLGNSFSALAQNEITFLAPRPVQRPIEKLIKEFEARTNYKVKAIWGSGLGTRQQVAAGEFQDVSVMFSPFPEALASGSVDKNSGATLMKLVMAIGVKKGSPRPDISTPDAVKKLLLSAKSITTVDPAQGSVGAAAMAILQRLGITDQVKPKLKVFPNGGNVQTAVAGGEIEIALGPYVSDMRNTGIDVVGGLPASVSTPTEVVGFISSRAKDSRGAKALLDYLTKSPEARAAYAEEGMTPGN
jgi:molybdate transport system substrate-binding protein